MVYTARRREYLVNRILLTEPTVPLAPVDKLELLFFPRRAPSSLFVHFLTQEPRGVSISASRE